MPIEGLHTTVVTMVSGRIAPPLRSKRLIPVTVAKVGTNPDKHNDQRQDDRAWSSPKPVEENREASPPDT